MFHVIITRTDYVSGIATWKMRRTNKEKGRAILRFRCV